MRLGGGAKFLQVQSVLVVVSSIFVSLELRSTHTLRLATARAARRAARRRKQAPSDGLAVVVGCGSSAICRFAASRSSRFPVCCTARGQGVQCRVPARRPPRPRARAGGTSSQMLLPSASARTVVQGAGHLAAHGSSPASHCEDTTLPFQTMHRFVYCCKLPAGCRHGMHPPHGSSPTRECEAMTLPLPNIDANLPLVL